MRQRIRTVVVALLLSGIVGASARRGASRYGAAAHPRLQVPPNLTAPLHPPGDDLGELEDVARLEGEQRKALDALASREDALRHRMVVRGRLLQRVHNAGLLPAGGGFPQFVEHLLRVGRARRALAQDLSSFEQLSGERAAAARALQATSERKRTLELARTTADESRELSEDAEARRRAFRRAFEGSSVQGIRFAPVSTDAPAADEVDRFRSLRGRLPFPLGGHAELRFVRRPGADGPGVEFAGAPGSVVRAVFPGRVAFADRYDSMGQLVIVDHGEHYFTVAGNLDGLDVRVGDEVSAGARLGSLGRGPDGSVLYFEIRHGSSTLDPKPWFGM